MIKIGLIIGGRYEILEKIGTGGMSDVYRARDHKLNRLVAVKVLKQEFAENENFVSKFVVEAQAAAGLMHSCIVNVYDVGDENGIHFIVMEQVDGITLKKYIEKKQRLTVKEAVSIAIQVAMGLEAAHNNHIIHRDIKPQNIMISKEGKVKVTDFGIAKAATSNTITSNVMGSVHYTSPEQARGGYSDAKSDIYSLGITLFEMLTGRLPFNGDTTVAIAIKHIQEELPSPRQFNEEIPISVEKIVLKCCQKSPDRRYQSASELIADLKHSLINPDEDFVALQTPDEESATRMLPVEETSNAGLTDSATMRLKSEVYEEEKRASRNRPPAERPVRGGQPRRRKRPQEDDFDDFDRDDAHYNPVVERLTVALAIIAAILVGVIVVVLVGRSMGMFGGEEVSLPGTIARSESSSSSASSGRTQEDNSAGILIPDVTGRSYAEAVSILEGDKGFNVTKEEDPEADAEKDIVVSMWPAAGSRAQSGADITVTVSTGAGFTGNAWTDSSASTEKSSDAVQEASSEQKPSVVSVPNVIGFTTEDAMVTLTEAGLTLGTIIDVNNDSFAADLITAQSKEVGAQVEPGTVVNLERSLGPISISYMYSGDITAPTEGENYSDGIAVHVTLVTADGTSLLDTTTASFPITGVVRNGLTSATGILTYDYTATSPSTTDADGNVIEGETRDYSVRRAITFSQEN
ncbi:MAG: Stk1 family PASTA domain-containing Ser/Thr kinase [Butyrivibrio sp.]|nr:Stk1 family PASTA domain-containing Ser/Thr kinase [Butyrivibrio sp.]